VKIFLDVSEAEQSRRILRRPAPTAIDLAALQCAGEFRRAAAEMLIRTSTPNAPWHVLGTDGDASETTALAYACIGVARRGGGAFMSWTEKSCSSGSVCSMSEEASSASRF
jgi:hypothetical protein